MTSHPSLIAFRNEFELSLRRQVTGYSSIVHNSSSLIKPSQEFRLSVVIFPNLPFKKHNYKLKRITFQHRREDSGSSLCSKAIPGLRCDETDANSHFKRHQFTIRFPFLSLSSPTPFHTPFLEKPQTSFASYSQKYNPDIHVTPFTRTRSFRSRLPDR